MLSGGVVDVVVAFIDEPINVMAATATHSLLLLLLLLLLRRVFPLLIRTNGKSTRWKIIHLTLISARIRVKSSDGKIQEETEINPIRVSNESAEIAAARNEINQLGPDI